ncbi:DUF1353 domain-containing protein [Tateyamaria sp. SN6-1]|uniref:DUF1353 domain-containing protein n=1 Tax=Tateyamaria sp. SN6-1 TaxID=3092148 RepID=UPI0039F4F81D
MGSGENSRLGNGRFLYVPVGDRALQFQRPSQDDPSKSIVIRPEAFYTDGGSIPRIVQAFPGFAAWGYGPAYVIHDWVFVARKCLNTDRRAGTDTASAEMKKIAALTFQDSADLLAEAIKTLEAGFDVPENGTGGTISSTTAGPFSLRLWRDTGPCVDRIDPAHQAFIDQLNRPTKSVGRIGVQSVGRSSQVVLENGDTIEIVDFISIN